MEIFRYIGQFLERILILPFLFMFLGSVILSFKTRFIQFRTIPTMIRLLYTSLFKKQETTVHTIKAHRALFTAMATSFGVGNIVAPIIAIGFGGPGALFAFALSSLFGTATVYTEVSLALSHRKKLKDGRIMGGPMQYLKAIHPAMAYMFAIFGCLMLISWSGKQSNTLALLLSSYNIPTYVTGIAVTILTAIVLLRGIKLIGSIAEKLVPPMFLAYAGSMIYILALHAHKIPAAFKIMFQSLFTPQALIGAGVGLGVQKAFQWGLSEAAFANEAGVGPITIPHSMSATESSVDQGILSMISVYSSGFLAMITGLTVLTTGIWTNPSTSFDITTLADILRSHFSFVGPIILVVIVILFAFTSILGNSYNGSQCFLYATKNRWLKQYYALIAILIFICAILDVKTLWALGPYFVVPVAIPNVIGIVILSFRKKSSMSSKN